MVKQFGPVGLQTARSRAEVIAPAHTVRPAMARPEPMAVTQCAHRARARQFAALTPFP